MQHKTYHHAFRTVYSGITNILTTDCSIALPLATNPTPKQFFTFKAIWDTGATNSVITENVVKKVSLLPTGMINCSGVHGQQQVNTYIVDIMLPNTRVHFINVKVSEGKLLKDFDILIGMDIIQKGDFAISNGNGKTVFSYCIPPHQTPIDLYEKSIRLNPKKRTK